MIGARNRESQQRRQTTRHGEFWIAIVHPNVNSLGRPIGHLHLGIDDDTVVVDRCGYGDGRRFGLTFGRVLRPTDTAKQKPRKGCDTRPHIPNCSAPCSKLNARCAVSNSAAAVEPVNGSSSCIITGLTRERGSVLEADWHRRKLELLAAAGCIRCPG